MSTGTTLSDTRKTHLAFVLMMAKADGRLDPREIAWIQTLAHSFGMDDDDIKEAEEEAKLILLNRGQIEAKLPESRGDRAVIIRDVMWCGGIDGHVDEDEYMALSLIVRWLGFSWEEDLKRIQEIGMSSNDVEDIRRAFS